VISLILFGSRTAFPTFGQIDRAIALWPELLDAIAFRRLAVISGMAKGADICGKDWGESTGLNVDRMPAAWSALGKRAGPVRNRQMAERATHALGWWHRESGGTANMAAHMAVLGKPCRIVEWVSGTEQRCLWQ
jgi:hypothetical protein